MAVICKLNVNSRKKNMTLIRNKEYSLSTVHYGFINIKAVFLFLFHRLFF